jgi:hypothetical protein
MLYRSRSIPYNSQVSCVLELQQQWHHPSPFTKFCAVVEANAAIWCHLIRPVHMFQIADSFRASKLLSAREKNIPRPNNRQKKKKSQRTTSNPPKSCQHIMGTPKALARSAPIKHPRDEASDVSQSDSDSQSGNESSDSDSLDSQASRKRRKFSPVEIDAPLVPTISVPSRIKSKVQENGNIEDTSNPAILAPVDSTITFSALNVKPWLVGSLGAMAIKRPTGIQKGCIPEILKGRDCIGGSRTGSGKTVAFAVPILQKWAEDPFGIFALVLTPTRYRFILAIRWN